jgi:uncharacterized SAM-binding protein YcdF (DUF218 family)
MDNLFFVLSKLAWGLLSPINLIILVISLATLLLLFNRISTAKWLLFPTVVVSLVVLAYPVGDYLMYPLEARFSKPVALTEEIDGIIVLGGGEDLKSSLSWQTAELGNASDRYFAAVVLARHYHDVPIIFSGGNNFLRFQSHEKEGHIAHQILTDMGIAGNRIIIESQSRNTAENFQLMKEILPKLDGKYLLVTSAFHMPRSVGIARQHAINVIPYPVDYRSNKANFRQLDFNLFEHLEVLEPAWREWIGLTVYYWTGKTSEWLPEAE